jgi:hypothetical protein
MCNSGVAMELELLHLYIQSQFHQVDNLFAAEIQPSHQASKFWLGLGDYQK